MPFCQNCGTEVSSGDVFCSGCRARLLEAQLCRECGSEVNEGSIYCHICGAALKEEEMQPQTLEQSESAEELQQEDMPPHVRDEEQKKKGLKWPLIAGLLLLFGLMFYTGWLVGQQEEPALRSEISALMQQSQSLQASYEELSAKYNDLNSEFVTLNTSYEAISQELGEIKKVYPPGEFSSKWELLRWLLSNDVSEKPPPQYAEGWYVRMLEIQEDALRDGYLVSASFYTDDEGETYNGYCTALIGDKLWWWYPDSDQIFPFDLDFS